MKKSLKHPVMKTPYFINEANLILNYSNSYKDFIIFNF